MNNYLKLSIIVPAYRAEKHIRRNLERFKQSAAALKNKVVDEVEIIAVIDGEIDKSEAEAKKVKGVKVVSYPENRGKGYALTYGFSCSTGNVITFIDVDCDLPPEQLKNFFPYLATADMVIGSKRHPFSLLEYPLIRRFLSKGFQLLSWLILGVSLRDTQSGMKIFKREILEVILPLILVKRYAFDLELCFLAHKHGFRIVEAPVHLEYHYGVSGINLVTPFNMLKDILAIRYRYSILKYYQKKFHETKFGIKS